MDPIKLEFTLPFAHGKVTFGMNLTLPDGAREPEETADCIFRGALAQVNKEAAERIAWFVRELDLPSGDTRVEKAYSLSVASDATVEFTLGLELNKELDPEVAIGVLASQLVPDCLEHAARDMINAITAPALDASGYAEQLVEKRRRDLMGMLGEALGGRRDPSDMDLAFAGSGRMH